MAGAATFESDQQASLWVATATPAPGCSPFRAAVAADVCGIGGGYTGLACALTLADNGTDVIVLKARCIGHGGSGRNGGQVIPGLKQDPDELLATLEEARVRVVGRLGRGPGYCPSPAA